MALPRGRHEPKQIKSLPASLGKSSRTDVQCVSGMPPKPSGPPENVNAALTGHQDGANQIGKKLAASGSEKYSLSPDPSTDEAQRTKVIRAKRLEIRLRYAWDAREKKRRGRASVVMKRRLRELERLFAARYRVTSLPDDDAGRDDLLVAAHHIAAIYRNPEEHIPAWVAQWAPWLGDEDCRALVTKVAANPLKWTADKLAWRLGLTDAERTALRITTIGSIDVGKAARARRRRQRNNAAKAARRLEAGAVSRAEYEGASATRVKPWEAAGVSRRTWYRKKKEGAAQELGTAPASTSTNGTSPGTAEYEHMLYPHLCHGPDWQGESTAVDPIKTAPQPCSTSIKPQSAAARLKRAPQRASRYAG